MKAGENYHSSPSITSKRSGCTTCNHSIAEGDDAICLKRLRVVASSEAKSGEVRLQLARCKDLNPANDCQLHTPNRWEAFVTWARAYPGRVEGLILLGMFLLMLVVYGTALTVFMA